MVTTSRELLVRSCRWRQYECWGLAYAMKVRTLSLSWLLIGLQFYHVTSVL